MNNNNEAKKDTPHNDSFEEQEELRARPKTLSYISVYTPPNKTTYLEGEYFDPTGMVIKAYYSDGTNAVITLYIYSPTNALTVSDTYISISYSGKTTTQSITVNPSVYLTSISIYQAPTKTTYLVGDIFEPYGMIIKAHYSNSTSQTITNYSYSPTTPLTINNNQITITYQNKTVNQAITFNIPPSSGYYLKQNISNANLGDNPYLNLFNQSLLFISESIEVGKKASPLSFNLIYHSRMPDRLSILNKGLPQRFKTNYHQYLILDGLDSYNNPTYKYIDGSGYTHTFFQVSSDLYYCSTSNLYLTFYQNNNQTYYRIIDQNKNSLHFDNEGRLIIIIKEPVNDSPTPSNILNINYSSTGYISSIYNELDDDTELAFVYDNQNRLASINFVYHYQTIKTISFSYSNNQLISLNEAANNQTHTLYSFIYNNTYNRLSHIKDHLNNVAYEFIYEFNQTFNDYLVTSFKTGYFNNQNAFTQKESLEIDAYSLRNDNTIKEITIKNQQNLYSIYALDKNANITASFEKDTLNTGNLKTFYHETGIYLDINGNQSVSINSHPFKNLTSTLSISLPSSSEPISFLNNYKHFVLRMYVRINNDASKRVKALLSFSNNEFYSRIINLNINQPYSYQLIEIPFTYLNNNLTSLTLSLDFKNETDTFVNVDIADLYLDKKDKTTLTFFNGSCSFDNLNSIYLYDNSFNETPRIINNLSYPYFTEKDLLQSLWFKEKYVEYGLSTSPIIFLANGESFESYSFAFTGLDNNNNVFIHPDHLSNSNLAGNDCWYFINQFFYGKTQSKTYYRLGSDHYEIITRSLFDNNDVFIDEEIKQYDYYSRLLSIQNSHREGNSVLTSSTSYEYFTNGELKKVSTSGDGQTIVLYEATENINHDIIRKSSGLNSVDISYSGYLESVIIHNQVSGSIITNSDFEKEITYDDYKRNITGISFKDNASQNINYIVGENNFSYNENSLESSFSLNNNPLYQIVNSLDNSSLTFNRYNGSTYENIISINQSDILHQTTYYDTNSNHVVVVNNYDNYGKILNQTLNNQNKVTFTYESNNVESSKDARLVSVSDNYNSVTRNTYFSYEGFDCYKTITLNNNEFVIQNHYNGSVEYCFEDGNYLYEYIGNNVEISKNNQRIQNFSCAYSYDAFNRLINKERVTNGSLLLFLSDILTYYSNSLRPRYYYHHNLNINLIYEQYSYDNYGNLNSIQVDAYHVNNASYLRTYSYDGFNRLTAETNIAVSSFNRSYSYNTDGRMDYFGNNYLSYSSKGQLSSFGTITFTYDRYGNRTKKTISPTNEENYTYERGKLLSSITKNSQTITFKYDYLGRRYQKETFKETVNYYYDDTRLIGEDHIGKTYQDANNNQVTAPSYKLRFFYHNDGTPNGLRYIYGSTIKDYIYIVNPFKEIVGLSLYEDNPSSTVVSLEAIYVYDAWGNHRIYDGNNNLIDEDDFVIGSINPIRYKGYYYDQETGLYYLMSRYYDSSVAQFISPDDYSYLDIESISGYHLYAYCNNNPVMYADESGHSAIVALLIAAGIGTLAGLAGQLTADVIHSVGTGEWVFSSWQQYLGAGFGGAIGGVLYTMGVGGIVTGLISAAAATFSGNGLEMITGDREANFTALMVDTVASGLIGALCGAIINIPGINRGSHSLHQIYKSGLTKVWKHSFHMSLKTMAKGFAMNYLTGYGDTLYTIIYSLAEDNGYL